MPFQMTICVFTQCAYIFNTYYCYAPHSTSSLCHEYPMIPVSAVPAYLSRSDLPSSEPKEPKTSAENKMPLIVSNITIASGQLHHLRHQEHHHMLAKAYGIALFNHIFPAFHILLIYFWPFNPYKYKKS